MKLLSWGTLSKLSGLLCSYFILQGFFGGVFFCLFFFHPAYVSEGRSYAFCDLSTHLRILLCERKQKQSSGEGRRMCWKHGSRKALRTNAEEMYKNRTQTHPVGFVTALTLAAPIEHAALQCY